METEQASLMLVLLVLFQMETEMRNIENGYFIAWRGGAE